MDAAGLEAISMKENMDFFKRFGSVAEYLTYRMYAAGMVAMVYNSMHKPYALESVADGIKNDRPYILTAMNRTLPSGVGSVFYTYGKQSIESALKVAHEVSGGAICWESFEDDDMTYYFIFVDPTDLKEKFTSLNKALGELNVYLHSKEEKEIPDFDEKFAPEPEPDLTVN